MTDNSIAFDLPTLIRVYKDGRIERYTSSTLPAGLDPITGVQSKDVPIPLPVGDSGYVEAGGNTGLRQGDLDAGDQVETGVTARLYIPKTPDPHRKLPLLIYIHGGGFVAERAFSPTYHPYLNSLVSNSQIVVVSIDYRLAPEHPLPAAYEDSWAVANWVGSHGSGSGPDPWLNQFADFNKVFFAGDSAGANIAHNMAIRIGLAGQIGFKLVGVALVHPYFGGVEPIGGEVEKLEGKGFSDKLWAFAKPGTTGSDDPDFNPSKDPRVKGMGGERVVVCVAEKDILKDRGWFYGEVLGKSGWGGKVEVVEDKDEDHVFHLFKPTCENAGVMMKRLDDFINQA